MKFLAAVVFALFTSTASGTPVADLESESPQLAGLLVRYTSYHEALLKYARMQGFREPYEMWATVVHEVIHIDSAAHQGYFIEGIYYEPYVSPEHWPRLRNRDIAPLMRAEERGLIHSVYMQSTPNNNLGNILDEVNAYTHVLRFVCKHEPASTRRQANNLIGHLNVVEAYLRIARISARSDYEALLHNRLSAGAVTTLTQRAWSALLACGIPSAELATTEAADFTRAVESLNKPRLR